MPALPWVQRQDIDIDREYVAMASRLPLKTTGWSPASSATRCESAVSSLTLRTGGLRVERGAPRKTFWTFSVWIDQQSLDRRSPPPTRT